MLYWVVALHAACLLNKLHLVQNAATRVLTKTRDHITPVLLPINHHIHFKIMLITYKALNSLAPQYFSELLKEKFTF